MIVEKSIYNFLEEVKPLSILLIEEDLAGNPIKHLAPTLQSVFLTLFQNNLLTYRDQYPLWIGSQAEQPNSDLEVIDKFTGEVVTRVALADEATIDRAIAAATAAAPAMAALPAYARQQALEHCVERFRERFDELAPQLQLQDRADLVLLCRGRELAHDGAVGQLHRDDEEGAAEVDHEAVDLAVLQGLNGGRVVVEDLRLVVGLDLLFDELEAGRAHRGPEVVALQVRDALLDGGLLVVQGPESRGHRPRVHRSCGSGGEERHTGQRTVFSLAQVSRALRGINAWNCASSACQSGLT